MFARRFAGFASAVTLGAYAAWWAGAPSCGECIPFASIAGFAGTGAALLALVALLFSPATTIAAAYAQAAVGTVAVLGVAPVGLFAYLAGEGAYVFAPVLVALALSIVAARWRPARLPS